MRDAPVGVLYYKSSESEKVEKKMICFVLGRILFASPTSPKIPILFDAERSCDLSALKREALRTAPVSPLAWHVVFGETQSRGTNMAEYKKGEYDVIKHLKYNNISIYLFC